MRQDILEPGDGDRFIRLHQAVTLYANLRLKIADPPDESIGIVSLPNDQRLKVWESLVQNLDLINAFIAENPFDFEPDELEAVRSWNDLVAGEFFVFRFLKKHTIFLSTVEAPIAYGVVGLTEPLEQVIPQLLPFFCKTVLLPYRGRIVYDGLLVGYNIIIGSNMRRELTDTYNVAKKSLGIVTSLPWNPGAVKKPLKPGTDGKKPVAKRSPIIGRWRIVWMEAWDQDYVDEAVEGYFRFKTRQIGDFQFGHVMGTIDYRAVERDGKPAVEFSWEGIDEMDLIQGRGWAFLRRDELEGRIFIHQGDESAFRAVREGR